MHEFTCASPGTEKENIEYRKAHAGENGRTLVATNAGWICKNCGYTQNWAHSFMVEMMKTPPQDEFSKMVRDARNK